jgi:hypothetical protein
MPGLPLSDTQNRYLALAWLCVDVEPKVSVLISVTEDHSGMCKVSAVQNSTSFSKI